MSFGVFARLGIMLLLASGTAGAAETGIDPVAEGLRLWSILPFAGVLLTIAAGPVFAEKWWHRNYPKVCAMWGVPAAVWILVIAPEWLMHTAFEYAGFIALLGALFVISGGIFVRGRPRCSPAVNTTILALGGVLASFIGTTGASMLLIRPLLRTNATRRHKTHLVVFFLFIVSNIGGCLTPLGDPPLYLGLLRGVPFFWTLRLFPLWLTACGVLLGVFFILDTWYVRRREEFGGACAPEKISIMGGRNFILLAGVMGVVILYSRLPGNLGHVRDVIQVVLMSGLAGVSWMWTPRSVHEENEFTWHPIREVAILFAAIFVCMIPALKLLRLHGAEIGVTEPWQFFWATGLLSAFLDNAPTYAAFLSLGMPVSAGAGDVVPLADGVIRHALLVGISCGAVFMGALTYVGNGPNFMVKSIADHMGVRAPGFFSYMAWSFGILIPTFLLVTFLFFL